MYLYGYARRKLGNELARLTLEIAHTGAMDWKASLEFVAMQFEAPVHKPVFIMILGGKHGN